ncbi:hypothetical protein K1719_020697 [Acacia pycnantha]|nr:hypothetical protein K1719_020697 [Acacia pycnantha]
MEIVPIPVDKCNVGFIGAAKMAESIARGAIRSSVLPPSRIRTAHSNPARRAAFDSIGVNVLSCNQEVIEDSDVVIFSVKPQVAIAPATDLALFSRIWLLSFYASVLVLE